MSEGGARRPGPKPPRRLAVGLLSALLMAMIGALTSPSAGSAVTLPLPQPPGLPPLPTLPGGSGSGGTKKTASAPPRPSRSPPSLCPGLTPPGLLALTASVFPCDFPDPMVLRAGGAWYAYGSSTGWETGGAAFPILRSTDLRHWQSVGNALSRPPGWSAGDLWGPSVLAWRHRYLLYYSAKQRGNGRHCVAVASSPSPQGPFRPLRRIACQSGRLRGFIDPAPLALSPRRLYLFFSVDAPRHSISILRLSASGLRGRGRVQPVLHVSRRWGRLANATVEGPWPLVRGGRFYLFYSAGSWSSDYRMAYARARSPYGPYLDSAPVEIVGPSPALIGPGGGSVVTGPDGRSWLDFAAWTGTPGYQHGTERTLRVAPLSWRLGGIPRLTLTG